MFDDEEYPEKRTGEITGEETAGISEEDDLADPADYDTPGDFYSVLRDSVEEDPDKIAEYLRRIRSIDINRNSAEDLNRLYDFTNYLAATYERGIDGDIYDWEHEAKAVSEYISGHQEVRKQVAQIYLSSLNAAGQNAASAKEALLRIGSFYRIYPENGSELIESFYRLSEKTGLRLSDRSCFYRYVVDEAAGKDIKAAGKFLDFTKQVLDSGHRGDFNFAPSLLNISKKYPELTPQIEELIGRELEIKIQNGMENDICNTLDSFKSLTDSPMSDFALDTILETVKETKSRSVFCAAYHTVDEIIRQGKRGGLTDNNKNIETALQIVREGFARCNKDMGTAVRILGSISGKREYAGECVEILKAVPDNPEANSDVRYTTFTVLCEIMDKYPENTDECLDVLTDMLPKQHNKEAEYDSEELLEITKTILDAAPERFGRCLPALKTAADEADAADSVYHDLIEIIRKFSVSNTSECTELFVSCLDKFNKDDSYSEELADSFLKAAEQMIDVMPELEQKEQLRLVDAVSDAAYNLTEEYDDNMGNLFAEKAENVYFKMLQGKNFSRKTAAYIADKVCCGRRYYSDEEKDFVLQVITDKLCTPEQVAEILKGFEENAAYDEIVKAVKQSYAGDAAVKRAIKAIGTDRRNKKIIDGVLREHPAGAKTEALIRLADAVVKTKDDEKIGQFKELLFSRGEEHVFAIDEQAMTWFVNNGKPEDLEALNNLSRLYGIKTELGEYRTVDPAQNAAYRIRFDGSYSEIGAVQYDRELDETVSNPHYYRMLSETYRKFRPDYSRDFRPAEYNLFKNKAFRILAAHGVKMPVSILQEAFTEIHMPPETAEKLNATDLQHLFVNYCQHKAGLEHDSEYDMESSENLNERIKEKRRGDRVPMYAVSSNAPGPVREKLWRAYGCNEQLVEFVSKDWKRMGVSEDIISDTWHNARELGAPVDYSSGRASHYGMRNTLHHALALRVGGTNDQSIIITNDIRKAGEEERRSCDGSYTVYRDGGRFDINSHEPFHLYDNPCVYLYQKSDGKLSVREKQDGRFKKRMMITRVPSAKLNDGERIAYYGGPLECSCAITDKNGNVRRASYDFWKDEPSAQHAKTVVNGISKKQKIYA